MNEQTIHPRQKQKTIVNMIIDHLSKWSLYKCINPLFEKAFQYIENTNFNQLSEGKHLIDNENVFALMQRYTTHPPHEMRYEAHEKYIDIQYLISGNESFLYNFKPECKGVDDYNSNNDVRYFNTSGNLVQVKQGYFYLLFPHDVHKPSLYYLNSAEPVQKVVIKVKVT